jgi:hypothetical protein
LYCNYPTGKLKALLATLKKVHRQWILLAFKQLGGFDTDAEAKRKVIEALDIVSKHLGNTRNVGKRSK